MKLNEKGRALWSKWDAIYTAENDRLGGDSANGYYIEGWSIIDTDEFVKSITDECGLLIFGYDDDSVRHVEEFIRSDGDQKWWSFDFTAEDLRQELLKYFEQGEETT